MKLRHLAAAGLAVVAAVLTVGGVAQAQVLTGPTTTACTEAKGVLAVKLKAVLDLSPDVLNGATSAADLTLAKLGVIKADPDLGEGGQAVVAAAISAASAVDRLCAEPTPTPTPTTMPTTPVTPTPTTAPCNCTTTTTTTKTKDKDDGDDSDSSDSDDNDSDSDDGDSDDGDSDAGVSRAPSGGVETGLE